MATREPNELCGICNGRQQITSAIKWCLECEEKLCKDCHINHSLSNVASHHTVIDIKDFRNIPDSILDIKRICDVHDMKYSQLCSQHDMLCCSLCISGPHSECKTLPLQDVYKAENPKAQIKSMEATIKSFEKNIKSIIKDRKSNLKHLQDQRQKIEIQIQQIKEALLKQVDEIEKKIMDDLNSRVKQKTTKLESEVANLEMSLRKSEALLKSTTALMDLESDLQTYIVTKSLEAEVARETNLLHDLVKNASLKRLGVKLVKTAHCEKMLKDRQLFGTVLDDVASLSFHLTSELDAQPQIVTLTPAVSISDIKLILRSMVKLPFKGNKIYGCSVIPPGRIIVANYARSCITILQQSGELDKEITISSPPYCVTMVDSENMAVSCDDGVMIIDITTGKTEKTIRIGTCHGVEYYNGSLICGVPGKGVISFDLTSDNKTTLVEDKRDGWSFCTVHRDHLYISRTIYNTVFSHSMNGDKLWKFKDNSIIHGPYGIAVDNSSNVYVASFLYNRVAILSPDGKKSRILLTEKDGIKNPIAVHFNRSNNQLLVVNMEGSGFLYNV